MWRTPEYKGPERRKARRWRPRPFRVLLALVVAAVLGYGGAVVWLISQETRLVFQAGRTLAASRPEFPYQVVSLPRHDGLRQFAWVMKAEAPEDGPWVLFLHDNAATVASNVNISHYRQLRRLGAHVLAPEYRGFGGIDGIPTEAAMETDARTAYDYLRDARGIPPSHIVIYGWSLGSAVAVDLASEVEHRALVLEGAPASLADVGQRRYPFFPIKLLMRNQFNSLDKIERVRTPILFLHSPEDSVIPIEEGRRLFDAARTEKTFVEVRGGHVRAGDEDTVRFYGAIRQLLERQGLIPSGD